MPRLVQMKQSKQNGAFDPNKNYKWEPDDIFELTGQQFASLYHALSQEVRDKGGASIELKYSAFEVLIEIFRIGVEQGVITEVSGDKATDQEVHISD